MDDRQKNKIAPSRKERKERKKLVLREQKAQRKAQAKRDRESVREQKRSYRRRKNSMIYLSFAMAFTVAAAIFTVSVFFTVDTVEVHGNTRYTQDEIISASGIKQGDNLLLMDKFSVTDRMLEKLIWLENIEIRRIFPDRIRITVSECSPRFAVEYDDGFWICDSSGRLLEYTPDPAAAPTVIYGAELVKPELGKVYVASDGPSAPLSEILDGLEACGLLERVNKISVVKIYDTVFELDGFRVSMGRSGDFGDKLRLVTMVIADLEAKGRFDAHIDVSSGEAVVNEE